MLRGSLLLFALLLLSLACSSQHECTSDGNCASDQVCIDGLCEASAEEHVEEEIGEEEEVEEEEQEEQEQDEQDEDLCGLQICSIEEFCLEGACLPLSFTFETVAAENVGEWYVSLSLDRAGAPHLSFKDNDEKNLLYARRGPEGWEVEVADDSQSVGRDSKIAIDPDGHPHIVYNDGANWTTKYAFFDGQEWNSTTILDITGFGQQMNIAIDDDGGVHVLLADESNSFAPRLIYARPTPEGWSRETVAAASQEGFWYNSIQIHNGIPYIAHLPVDLADDAPRELRLSHRVGDDEWSTEAIPVDGPRLGAYTPLGFGPDGHPQIAYHIRTSEDFSAGTLHLARFDGDQWTTILVDDRDAAGLYLDMAVDPWGRAHIIYGERNSATLRYARYHEGEWLRIDLADLGTGPLLGSWLPAIAVDARGIPHLSFHDPGTDTVRYATYELNEAN